MLKWSMRIINVLLYENGEIWTLVSIGVRSQARVTAILTNNITRVNMSPYSYNNL